MVLHPRLGGDGLGCGDRLEDRLQRLPCCLGINIRAFRDGAVKHGIQVTEGEVQLGQGGDEVTDDAVQQLPIAAQLCGGDGSEC